jgi:hypothetical protein
MKKLLIAICLIPLFIGCAGPEYLQTKLNRNQYPLGYLYDSPKKYDKLDISISPNVLDYSGTTHLTNVKKEDGRNLFFIVMVHYDFDYTVSLGRNSVKPNLSEFIRQSFINESHRSGIYKINDSSSVKKLNVLIEIVDFKVQSKYHEDGLVYVGVDLYQNVNVQPSFGSMSLRLKISDSDNNVLLTKEYKNNKTSNYVSTRSNSEYEINNNLMQNMTEAMAQCIKENISGIVNDINETLIQ